MQEYTAETRSGRQVALRFAADEHASRLAATRAELRRRGVPITLNTDDLVVSDVTLSEEYLSVHRRLGLPVADLIVLARTGYDFAFVEQGTKTRLRNALETWLSQRGM